MRLLRRQPYEAYLDAKSAARKSNHYLGLMACAIDMAKYAGGAVCLRAFVGRSIERHEGATAGRHRPAGRERPLCIANYSGAISLHKWAY